MGTQIYIRGIKGIKVKGKLIRETRGVKSAYFVECKGGTEWFPKSIVNVHFGGTMDVQMWRYNKSPEFFEIVYD